MRQSYKARSIRGSQPLLFAIVAICALMLCAGSALAASNLEFDCGERSGADDLTISIVDLTTTVNDELVSDRHEFEQPSGNAPILKLGTRVATIIRGVFEDESLGANKSSVIQNDDTSLTAREAAVGPLAGSRTPLESPEEDAAEDELRPYSPLDVQREMYRTDI